MSIASSHTNPFVGPDPAAIRDINIKDRVPVIPDAPNSMYYTWKTYFLLLFCEENLVDHINGTVDSRAMGDDPEWCRLKQLSDELRDIGAKVDDNLLLSTLTVGLNEDFGNTAGNLTLMPDPSFPKFVAYLKLEERRMKGVNKRVQHQVVAAITSRGIVPHPAPPSPRQQ
ncbi:Thioredoxin H-type [Hordeum vulgare]|nr:Thioredoxin H-type [Hordeum vulgare]